jgi:cytochrome c
LIFTTNVSRQNWRTVLIACAIAATPIIGNTTEAMSGSESAALTDKEMRRGRLLFMQCSACHALTADDNGGKIGPSLAGVFGRNAGSAAHYEGYSAALKDAGHLWNSETMTLWLTDPSEMVPGTSMVFAGIKDDAQRDLIVRYLEVVTAPDAE